MTDQTYPVAPNDEARVKMLHDLKILDTASEETFDRVTEMMTIIFNIPTTISPLLIVNGSGSKVSSAWM